MSYQTLRYGPLVLFCLALLPACAPVMVGPPTLRDVGRYMTLVPGQSTKGDVYTRFGQPYDVQPTDEGSRWLSYYGVARVRGWTYVPLAGLVAGGNDLDLTIVTVSFDGQEHFTRLDTQERASSHNMWASLAKELSSGESTEARVEAEMTRLRLPYDAQALRAVQGLVKISQ